MAMQIRRGGYAKWDPMRMQPGELAAVLQDDPSASDGRAGYLTFEPGIVKRIAFYEDMLDWFAELKTSTIDSVVADAMADIRAKYANIEKNTLDAEAERVGAEVIRETHEESRIAEEALRAAAETLREQAEQERIALYNDLVQKLAANYFDGATFTPSVDSDGWISFTNDKGKPNPDMVNIKGPKGDAGVVTELETGFYAMEIRDGILGVICSDGTTPPEFKIEDKQLYVAVGE